MTNIVKAILIINAKKGWSEAARKKAAMTRKAKSKYGVGGKNAHKNRVTAYKDANTSRAKLSSQSVKSMTETRKLLGLPDYLHKGGSSKAHQEVAKKALSTASSLTDPAAIKKYKDLAKVHKDLAKQFKTQENPRG